MKTIPFLAILIYPIIVIFAVAAVFVSPVIERIPSENIRMAIGMYLFPMLAVIILLATAATIFAAVYTLVKSGSQEKTTAATAVMSMILKLLHIPEYIIIFVFAFICLSTIFTAPFAIILALADFVTIFSSGCAQLSAVIRGYREGKLTKKASVIVGILGFLYLADIPSSVWLAIRVCRK